MGPKIVSQMLKQEEATHIKGQADSPQLKLSTLHKAIGRKEVFRLDVLDFQDWLPLPTSF